VSGSGLPLVKPGQLIRALERMGFRLARKSGSGHRRYAHPDGRRTTVPMHKGSDIGPGLLRKILRDIEMDVDELRTWL
jgi:predicted RNA binding protein YcfA (HicA-like mRNA interferase family)